MANKVFVSIDTPVTFKASGGTVLFTPTSITAARISAQHDLGSTSHAFRYEWRAQTKLVATPAVGDVIKVYLATSDGTLHDGNEGTADAALSATDKTRNMWFLGDIVVDKATAADPFIASGIVDIYARHVSVVWHNKSAVALSATAGDHEFILTPVPPEVQ